MWHRRHPVQDLFDVFRELDFLDMYSDGPTIATRDQMAALAAGLHPRCGRHGSLLVIMGPSHQAHHFVRDLLWSDLVLPTLKSFILDAVVSSTASPGSDTPIILSLVLSPVLFSLFRGPARMPYGGFHYGRFVDATHTAELDHSGNSDVTVYNLPGKTKVVLAPPKAPRGQQHQSGQSWAANSKWGVTASVSVSYGKPPITFFPVAAATAVTVAIVPIGGALVGGSGDDRDRDNGGKGDDCGGGSGGGFVVVNMPVVVATATMPHAGLHVQMDECSAGEAIITQYTESAAAIVVVDVERTYSGGKSLVVLSTTKWEVPSGHSFLRAYVLRRSIRATRRRTRGDNCSSSCGGDCGDGVSRVFIVQSFWDRSASVLFCVEEGTGSCQQIPLLDGFKVDQVNRVTNSLFCVSFRTSDLQVKKLAVYHCDDVNHPTLVLTGERGTSQCRFTAQGGFIFKVLSDRIVVLEPFHGNTVLTIHFPGFKRRVSLMTTPFSCFLSSSQY
ncbi:hypothetical protein Pelo_17772 [Pelomyxa schiedti]|nr:hypothetical protein Pelo_17772 [Pelomyxa schiedti]